MSDVYDDIIMLVYTKRAKRVLNWAPLRQPGKWAKSPPVLNNETRATHKVILYFNDIIIPSSAGSSVAAASVATVRGLYIS